MADASGRAAEGIVLRHYERVGARHLETRWRGQGGEIDLIVKANETVVFVEVKSSKSFSGAAQAVSARQQARIMVSAQEYVGRLETGSLTEMRFDVALVDAQGAVKIIQAAFGI